MKLIVENLSKNFGEKEVLKDITFTFEEGKIYGLLGINGAGKTTLFNCLNEDISVNSGNCYIEEENKKRNLTSDDISYVLAVPSVPDFLTGREFLKFFLDINKDKVKNRLSIDEYFDLISIDKGDRDKLIKDYSLGMKNKMQMIVNIISNSNVLLLDEPLTSFDVVVAEEMKELLKSIKNNRIIIFSTHILDLATSLCDEIIVLSNGRLKTIDKHYLSTDDFKNKIIDTLKEDKDV